MENIQELINKFPNGIERFNTDPVFNKVIQAIARGLEPLEAIDFLFKMIESQGSQISELIKYAPPKPILISTEDLANVLSKIK